MRVGADTGGTFTDVVSGEGMVGKVPSTPEDPGRAVRQAVDAVANGERPNLLAHGTTVATNALLERRGSAVALVTTSGLTDVLEIARQDRPSLYDADVDRPEPLVPRRWRYEVGGRLAADGTELEAVDPSAVPEVDADVEAVAVCLLHADLDPSHERLVAGALTRRGHDVTCSSDVSPEFREFERTVTTVVNAYLRPSCRSYLRALDEVADRVLVMTSAGGLVPAAEAAEVPAALLLSGPAAGVRAGAAVAAACGWPDAVTFDMGGTSTDVCLVRGGMPEAAPGLEAGGLPVRLPAIDIHTIGAGGGSIARIDPGGALVVGPESAGAVPGPACYGRGGRRPTVTDADLVLGRIPAGAAFPGLGVLDVAAAEAALADADVDAAGVVRVVDAGMERALRRVSVERGVDPRELALVAFGGAGPLHACALADALGMAAVIVPPRAGVLSAVGLLCSPVQRDLVRSWPTPDDHEGLAAALDELATEAVAAVLDTDFARPAPGAGVERAQTGTDEGAVGDSARRAPRAGVDRAQTGVGEGDVVVTTAVDCRYAGQSHELTVPDVDSFPAEHRRRNGYARPGAPIEVVALRARATLPAPLEVTDLPVPEERTGGVGPVVIAEADCTIWVPEGWRADPGPIGALVLTRTGSS